jgi:hypothetical protein
MIQFNQNDVFDEKLQTKRVDPLDNEALLEFLRNGKFASGTSRKQVNRVTNLAKHFRLEGDVLSYRKNLNNFNFRIFPKPLERHDIIEQAHSFGHFEVAATYHRIKGKYYWYNIINDVILVCKKCLVCIRNKKFKFQEHEAIRLPHVLEIYCRKQSP